MDTAPRILAVHVRQFAGHHALILGNPRHAHDLHTVHYRMYILRLLSVSTCWAMTHASTPGLHPPPPDVDAFAMSMYLFEWVVKSFGLVSLCFFVLFALVALYHVPA